MLAVVSTVVTRELTIVEARRSLNGRIANYDTIEFAFPHHICNIC